MEVCGKHDVIKRNGKCWCCEQENKKPETASTSTKTPVATGGK